MNTGILGDDQVTAFTIFHEEKLRELGQKPHMGLTNLLGESSHKDCSCS